MKIPCDKNFLVVVDLKEIQLSDRSYYVFNFLILERIGIYTALKRVLCKGKTADSRMLKSLGVHEVPELGVCCFPLGIMCI